MKDAFFSATDKALANITATYDIVWPMATGLWNLRCMVNGVKNEFPDITEAQLAAKFGHGSGIRGVNYQRAFIDFNWEKQQEDFAWILLNSTIPIYEGWLEEMNETVFSGANMHLKKMQFPEDIKAEVTRLTTPASVVLKNAFYSTYLAKKERCYSKIEALMHCYRVFKEARNCYMHNRGIADQKLVTAYSDYSQFATTENLGVKEVPVFFTPVLNAPIKLSLRGVVGFSHILIKILVSLDTELLCSTYAENELIAKYHNTDNVHRTLNSDPSKANRQVIHYVRQCGLSTPKNPEEMKNFLLQKNLVKR